MKIYLVTMKGLPDNQLSTRISELKKEALHTGDEPYVRPYSWVSKDDDEKYFEAFRVALESRMNLLESVGITIPGKTTEERDGYTEYNHFLAPTFACTGGQLLQILEVDDSITIKSASAIAEDGLEGIIERFQAVVAKMEALDIPAEQAYSDHILNEHCNVHVPGNVLISYNDTMLLEDSCTDNLQGYLNSGWRIVAVCPQAQRRPDYILGRYNPDLDIGGTARRG